MIYPCVEDADEDDIYIGSTTQPLSTRMGGHRREFRTNNKYCSSHVLFNKYGLDNCKIELLYDYPCENKKELEKEEGKNIRENKCVNKYVAGRTPKKYREDNKEQILEKRKEYREDNKEQINIKKKEHYEKNKEKINERMKKYYEDNKEQIKEHNKKYREDNKEQLKERTKKYYQEHKDKMKEYFKEKITCECGCIITKHSLNRHKKSKKHLINIPK